MKLVSWNYIKSLLVNNVCWTLLVIKQKYPDYEVNNFFFVCFLLLNTQKVRPFLKFRQYLPLLCESLKNN